MGTYARLRLQNGDDTEYKLHANKDKLYNGFNYKEDVLDKILDSPVDETGMHEDKEDTRPHIYIFDLSMTEPDWNSIPFIEKLHNKARKYTEIIKSVILSYYTVTKNKHDTVRLTHFEDLLSEKLTGEKYSYMRLDKPRQIISMVIAKLNNYSTPNYMDCTTGAGISCPPENLLSYLRIKENIIKNFRYNHRICRNGCIEDFNKKYECNLPSVDINKVKEIAEYIKSSSYFIRIDIEEFSIKAEKVSNFMYKKSLLNDPRQHPESSIICLLACHILGCKIYKLFMTYTDWYHIGINLDLTQMV